VWSGFNGNSLKENLFFSEEKPNECLCGVSLPPLMLDSFLHTLIARKNALEILNFLSRLTRFGSIKGLARCPSVIL